MRLYKIGFMISICTIRYQLNEGCDVQFGCVEPKHITFFAESSFYDSSSK